MEYKDVQNDLVVKGTAVLLKTNVKVFSFDPATKSLTETIYRSRQQLCNKDTIVLGHITDKPFVPLRIKQKQYAITQTTFVADIDAQLFPDAEKFSTFAAAFFNE